MFKDYNNTNYLKICNEVLKEVFFKLEKKILEEKKTSPKVHSWEDIEELKKIIKNILETKKEEFSIVNIVDGTSPREIKIIYKDPKSRMQNWKNVFELMKQAKDQNGNPLLSTVANVLGRSSIPYTQLNFLITYEKNGKINSVVKSIILIHKFDSKTTKGLTQENILAYVLDRNQDLKEIRKLFGKLGGVTQSKNLDEIKIEIDSLLRNPEWEPFYNMALNAKEQIEKKFGKVIQAKNVGGRSKKEDIIITLASPWNGHETIHLSSKLALLGNNPFVANMDLGDGINVTRTFPLLENVDRKDVFADTDIFLLKESEDAGLPLPINLVPSPYEEPWWIVVRKRLANKYLEILNKEPEKNESLITIIKKYLMNESEIKRFAPPEWFFDFRNGYESEYNSIIKEFHQEIREIFNKRLVSLSPEQLAKIVRYAYIGNRDSNAPPLFKITMSPSRTYLEPVEVGTISDINQKEPIIKTKDTQTIIDIKGMTPLIISGVKFRNHVLSSTPGDLKIKTRS